MKKKEDSFAYWNEYRRPNEQIISGTEFKLDFFYLFLLLQTANQFFNGQFWSIRRMRTKQILIERSGMKSKKIYSEDVQRILGFNKIMFRFLLFRRSKILIFVNGQDETKNRVRRITLYLQHSFKYSEYFIFNPINKIQKPENY